MNMPEIKREMLKRPEKIVDLLTFFSFEHIYLKPREIRFARDEDGGPNIAIRLEDNDNLTVVDFVKDIKTDIFAYIMSERHMAFTDVLNKTKEIFGFSNNGYTMKKHGWFIEGTFDETRELNRSENREAKIYDESELKPYIEAANMRFYRDHIAIETQKKFHILYNISSQRIGIPIRDFTGNLCGIKARRNYETDNDRDPKYIYELPCEKSLLLYGYPENYNYLYGADAIYIGESEKFVMQCDSYGYHNAVAIMGSSISPKQAGMLLSLRAKKYCFMFDEGLGLDVINRNIEELKRQAHGKTIEIQVFDSRNCKLVNEKDSPTDHGKQVWEKIIHNNMVDSSLIQKLVKDEDDEI